MPMRLRGAAARVALLAGGILTAAALAEVAFAKSKARSTDAISDGVFIAVMR